MIESCPITPFKVVILAAAPYSATFPTLEKIKGIVVNQPLLPPIFHVQPVSAALDEQIQSVIDNKTKPLGSLGKLEALAAQLARIQQNLSPRADEVMHLVFAADHGVCDEGVSPFPQEVTAQMVLNFLRGGAAINVFCRHNRVGLKVIDAGVAAPLPSHPDLISVPVRAGTANFTLQPAMTKAELMNCLEQGAAMVDTWAADAQILSLGEMGIGNTTAAAAILASMMQVQPSEVVGAGTGASEQMQQHKAAVIAKALARIPLGPDQPLAVLQQVGGLEIAMMVGAFLRGASLGKLLLVDGFIATSAWWIAYALQPALKHYTVFAHQSDEQGHTRALQALQVTPLLQLDMRLGEGTGAVAAVPLLRLAAAFFNEMASFADAGVSNA